MISASIATNIYQYTKKQEIIATFDNTVSHEDILSPIQSNQDIDEQDNSDISEFSADYILEIPCIDSLEPVVEGTDRSALSAALGHEESTVLPGEVGNCVIAGHRNYTFGKYFNRLNEVEIGDMIYIHTPTDEYSYQVSEIKTVRPEDVDILENTENEILTLYTCTPIYIATHRLVVVAERVYN
ncbi:sortase A [Butyrivibrio proteoclasticus]|uniref:Sortase A n=2 Tax=Butyrivibrio proteoclasticus TaxID=43305 RepID=A0A1I5U6U5_9FIRM|nr:sortase A [Butyrivibrio proteoclasticus]